MPIEMSISQFVQYLTIKVSTADSAAGPWTSSGTGFFFTFEKHGQLAPAIITNKHVIAKAARIGLQFHEAEKRDGGPQRGPGRQVALAPDQTVIIQHPDPDVDLAAIFAGPIIAAVRNEAAWEPCYSSLTAKDLPTAQEWADFMTIEDVTMIGYPNGLFDEHNNTAVARRGITASPLQNDYQGRKEFLIDMAVFGGSSGSPVLIVNEGSFAQGSGLSIGSRFHLMGVLYAGHYLNASGRIIAEPAPTDLSPRVEIKQMIHLGLCVKSERILEFIPLIPIPPLGNQGTSQREATPSSDGITSFNISKSSAF